MNAKLPDNVLAALRDAKRSPGWNSRRDDVRRFTLPNRYGHEPCLLYIVPCRRWAYRRWRKQAAAWQREHGGNVA